MDSQERRNLHHPDLLFFGRIVAGATHELNNVFSILEQLTGMLEDHLVAVQQGDQIDPELLWRVRQRLEKQTDRGVEMVHHLNRFAHTVDEVIRDGELGAVMETFQVLAMRFSNLKRVELTVYPPSEIILLQKNPFHMVQALFLLLVGALEEANRGESISLRAGSEDTRAILSYSGSCLRRVPQDVWNSLLPVELLAGFDGELEVLEVENSEVEISLSFPAKIVSSEE